ncbi:MAG: tetratricopeptide repeat protein [Bacteroidales bacterium]
MSNRETNHQEHDQLDNVQEVLNTTEQFIEKYKNQLLAGVAIVVLAVSGFFAFQHYYLIPKENKAEAAMYKAEMAFEKDSFNLALYGNSDFDGFESIINEYGMTKAANLATAYAGVCYYHLGEYEKAISSLKDFKGSDQMVSPELIGLIGHSYVELGKLTDAVKYFEKASDVANNDLISPMFLLEAGKLYLSLGNNKSAESTFSKVKSSYPNSVEAIEIDKYIEKARIQVK